MSSGVAIVVANRPSVPTGISVGTLLDFWRCMSNTFACANASPITPSMPWLVLNAPEVLPGAWPTVVYASISTGPTSALPLSATLPVGRVPSASSCSSSSPRRPCTRRDT